MAFTGTNVAAEREFSTPENVTLVTAQLSAPLLYRHHFIDTRILYTKVIYLSLLFAICHKENLLKYFIIYNKKQKW